MGPLRRHEVTGSSSGRSSSSSSWDDLPDLILSHMALEPHTSLALDDDPSNTYQRNALWSVHVLHCLSGVEADELVRLAEEHASAHGWTKARHKFYPTTDIEVGEQTAPALHTALQPLVNGTVLPTLARLFEFDVGELRMRDLFVVKYEASTTGVQDRLRPHRDGNLLSFSLLLSDPLEFEGGGLRFQSVGPLCDACGGSGSPSHGGSCEQCNGVGRLAIPNVGRGDLTAHCGKLLHEGAPVRAGRRLVVVGFVIVDSPRIDDAFVNGAKVANTSIAGEWADHVAVGAALRPAEPPAEMHACAGAALAEVYARRSAEAPAVGASAPQPTQTAPIAPRAHMPAVAMPAAPMPSSSTTTPRTATRPGPAERAGGADLASQMFGM